MIGWILLSRDQVARAEEALKPDTQGVVDEVGLLALHQGFADRFFPGTSVLHTRLRYALFVPWAMEDARGDPEQLKRFEIRIAEQLAQRWDKDFTNPWGIIGIEKLPGAPSQTPSMSYWGAISTWGLLRPDVATRSRGATLKALAARSQYGTASAHRVDGEPLDTPQPSPFVELPSRPEHWLRPGKPLSFTLSNEERTLLRRHWLGLWRDPELRKPSLLATFADLKPKKLRELTTSHVALWQSPILQIADEEERPVLKLAGQAAALAGIARAVYAALVEGARADDGSPVHGTPHRSQLGKMCRDYGPQAQRLDLDQLTQILSDLPADLVELLRTTQAWLRVGTHPLGSLYSVYESAEWNRKKERSRLPKTKGGSRRRSEWLAEEHPEAHPLHYRWPRVRGLLADLAGT